MFASFITILFFFASILFCIFFVCFFFKSYFYLDLITINDHIVASCCGSCLNRLWASCSSCKNGLSDTWILIWLFRVLDCLNCFLHTCLCRPNGFEMVCDHIENKKSKNKRNKEKEGGGEEKKLVKWKFSYTKLCHNAIAGYLQHIQTASLLYGFSCGWLMCLIAEIALRTAKFPHNKRKESEKKTTEILLLVEPLHDWWYSVRFIPCKMKSNQNFRFYRKCHAHHKS